MTELLTLVRKMLRDIAYFALKGSGITLRAYQEEVARAIIDSVLNNRGLTFVIIFPRQSGKNELQSQIESYLLVLYSELNAELVKVSPTFKPQTLNAMRRLERVLARNLLTRFSFVKEQGYIYRMNTARMYFFSGAPTANVVGATASHLLECDEAQDVTIAKWDKDINPMAASTNATRVFWGTAWTSQTLLARERLAAIEAQRADGVKRVFELTADQVRQEVPAYGIFVDAEIAKLGRNHPFVRSQYFSEWIDAEGGMFPPARRALMQGSHPPLESPLPLGRDGVGAEVFAFLLDFAGEDESVIDVGQTVSLSHSSRDSTALTIVRVDLSLLTELRYPRYQVVHRQLWTGIKHSKLFGQLVALAESWKPRWIICDATGIGAGLTSFLEKTFGSSGSPTRPSPGIVIPFVFTQASKSKLGWDFLTVIESGRFQDHLPPPFREGSGVGSSRDSYKQSDGVGCPPPFREGCKRSDGVGGGVQSLFWQQIEACQYEILPGPGRLMRWGVPDGTRDPASGELIHDDLVISASLCALLDGQTWGLTKSEVIQGYDPISMLGDVF